MTKRTSKIKIVTATVLIFSLGILVGAFGAKLYYKNRIDQLFPKDGPPPVVHLFLKRLSRNVDLTKEQERRVEALVKQSFADLQEIKSKYRPELEALINRTFDQISEELDDQQKKQLSEFRRRFQERRARRHTSAETFQHPSAHDFYHEVTRRITLTRSQRDEIRTIINHHVSEQHTIRDSMRNGNREEAAAGLRQLNQETGLKLSQVLSAEQMPEYLGMWEEYCRKGIENGR